MLGRVSGSPDRAAPLGVTSLTDKGTSRDSWDGSGGGVVGQQAHHEALIWIRGGGEARGGEGPGREFVNDGGGGDAPEWRLLTCAAVRGGCELAATAG